MTEGERAEMRALVLEAVGSLVEGLQKHLDEQVLELQVDVDAALEKLDGIEIDVKDTRVQLAKVSRDLIRERRRDEALAKRLAALERFVGKEGGS